MTEWGSLEPILEEVRRYHRAAEATPEEIFNRRHRQFLDLLRHAKWTHASKMPDPPRTKKALLLNGWIERRETPDGTEYRITQRGLNVVRPPR